MVFVRFILFSVDTVRDFYDKNCPYIAGAISFYALFALFPLMLATISILGFVLGPRTHQEQLMLAKDIAEVLPISREYVGETVQGLVRTRAITGTFSVFGLLWAATAAFGAIRKGINAAWGIKRPRPFLKERLIDFALVVGAGMLMLAVLFTGPALDFLRQIADVLDVESKIVNDYLEGLLSSLFSPTTSFAAFLVLYRFLPNTQVRLKDVWVGALLASLAFEGVKWGFVYYVQTYLDYTVIYGSVGAVVALLTWVYLSAIIVLLGALVTSRYAAYASSFEQEKQNLRFLWTGFSRVRLRVVESTDTG